VMQRHTQAARPTPTATTSPPTPAAATAAPTTAAPTTAGPANATPPRPQGAAPVPATPAAPTPASPGPASTTPPRGGRGRGGRCHGGVGIECQATTALLSSCRPLAQECARVACEGHSAGLHALTAHGALAAPPSCRQLRDEGRL
jgi:hypothetical protein